MPKKPSRHQQPNPGRTKSTPDKTRVKSSSIDTAGQISFPSQDIPDIPKPSNHQQPTPGRTKSTPDKTTAISSSIATAGQTSFQDISDIPKQSFARRKITSNWERYNRQIENNDDDTSENETNFSHILKQSNADGFHFQLAAEKEWEEKGISDKPKGSLFSLDLNSLSLGLSTIPFYERIGLDKEMLRVESVAKYESVANTNLKKKFPKAAKASAIVETDVIDKVKSLEIGTIEDETAPKKETIPISEEVAASASDEDENLEDWLDGVLDK